MKCLTCFFSLFALLIFSLYLSGCYMGFITEAEPDPRKIVDIQGDTQKFSVNGVEPANGNGRFEWAIWRDDDLEHIDSGKEFIWQMPLEGERNKLEVVCYLVTTGWVYLIPGVHMCGGWYMPPCGWYENTGWIDRRIWEVRISQEPPVWKGDYIIESDMDAQALNGFTEVTGSLLIRCEETDFHRCSEELFSIEALDNLILIGGDLIIVDNPSLTTLAGLDNLTSVLGSLEIEDNADLTSLTGLDSLASVGGNLDIRGNNSLSTLAAFSSLTSVGGALDIHDNPVLMSLAAFSSLTSVGGGLHIEGTALTTLTGLENVTSVGGNLDISNNDGLTTLAGLDSLISVNRYMYIEDNDSLTALLGLNNLTSVGEYIDIKSNDSLTNLTGLESLISVGGLHVENNASLTTLTDFGNITSFRRSLWINDNHALTTLTGFDSLASLLNLWIRNNNALTALDLDTLDNIRREFEISDNNELCTYLAEDLRDQVQAGDGIGDDITIEGNKDCSNP